MGALTGDEIISGIAAKIRANFSADEIAKIYKDKSLQGMVKPCAFLRTINAEHAPEMGTRANRDYLVDIRIHPPDSCTTKETWCQRIAEKMSSVILLISISGQVTKARKIYWNTEDEVLHVFAAYSFKVLIPKEEEPNFMDSLLYRERMK